MREKLTQGLKALKPAIKKAVPPGVIRAGKALVVKQIQQQMLKNPKIPYERGAYPDGINLIGPVDASTGLGQSFRLVERVIRGMGIPYMIYPFAATVYSRTDISEYEDRIGHELKYSVNLWHVSALEFGELYAAVGKKAFDRHYNIAYWLWELENFPDEWVGYTRVQDEIWTPSEFISRALRRKVTLPVVTVPYWVSAKTDPERFSRKWFRLPEKRFLFLMMYDSNSVSERKNPDGAIAAFRRAFTPDRRDVALVIKAGSLDKNGYRRLKSKLTGYRNIRIIRGNLEKTEVNSLIACSDALISLHRAEGFGLVLAEAMLNHVPVIATDWSANTEFMDDKCACMVPYRMVRLTQNIFPYKKGEQWADPDVEAAARFMRRLADDRAYWKQISDAGFAHVREKLGQDQATRKIRRRMEPVFLPEDES